MKEQLTYKPVREIITPSGKHVLEFPKMVTGYVAFKINAKKGDTIKLQMGEMLDKNGEFSMANIQCRNKKTITPLQMITYICKDGINEYRSKFYYGGFRYILIESDAKYNLEDFESVSIHNDFDKVSTFDSSNDLINIFFENTYNSTICNLLKCLLIVQLVKEQVGQVMLKFSLKQQLSLSIIQLFQENILKI